MELKKNKGIYFLLLMVIFTVSCSNVEDTFGPLAKKPETIYVGSPDTLIVQSGYEKLRLSIVINADPKIKRGEVTIGNDSAPIKFDINRKRADVDTTHIDLKFNEGTYRLGVTLFDNDGNKSLVKTVLANVLGESYIKMLSVKVINSVNFTKSSDIMKTGALITFGSNYEGLNSVRLKYLDSKGLPAERIISGFLPSTILNDYLPGSEVIAESIYLPINPFYEFKSVQTSKSTLPSCNKLSLLDFSKILVHFEETEFQKNRIKSFKFSSKDCILGPVKLTSESPFLLSTTESGNFGNTLTLNSISEEKTIFVLFKPTSNKDSSYVSKITAEGVNIMNVPIVELSGKEK